jgi:hypothetical protein
MAETGGEVNDEFRKQYMQEMVDEKFDLFVRAWMAYHEAAHAVDGHLPPGHPSQRELGHYAVRAGKEAMAKHIHQSVIQTAIAKNDWVTHNIWNAAKLEALRRLGMK